jgi:hypothetical protein
MQGNTESKHDKTKPVKTKSKQITKYESAAVLTVIDCARMSIKRRKEISDWLKRTASLIRTDGNNFSKRFRARFMTS